MKDLLGKALWDYQTQQDPQDLITETNISEPDAMSVAYMFREFSEMPKLEQKALQLANGRVLDVGCGAGSHALFLQNQRKLDVTAMDISPKAIDVCKLRGVQNALKQDVMTYELPISEPLFDTILLLMNGTGICGKLKLISGFLFQLKSLLSENGQILVDSSDLIYMFDEDEDGGKWISTDMDYYGELVFQMTYKNEHEDSFPWLYVDFNTLQNAAHANGLTCELVMEGENYDYLARLQKM